MRGFWLPGIRCDGGVSVRDRSHSMVVYRSGMGAVGRGGGFSFIRQRVILISFYLILIAAQRVRWCPVVCLWCPEGVGDSYGRVSVHLLGSAARLGSHYPYPPGLSLPL